MSDPILYLVDDRPRVLEALAADLGRRFGADHRILAATDPGKALDELEQLAGGGEEVGLVVAGQKMAQVPGVLFLCRAHELHPSAKRVLLVGRRAWTPANPAVRAMTLGQIDTYLFEPWLPVAASCTCRSARSWPTGCRRTGPASRGSGSSAPAWGPARTSCATC